MTHGNCQPAHNIQWVTLVSTHANYDTSPQYDRWVLDDYSN